VLDLVMQQKQMVPFRERIGKAASGRVRDVGIGSGLNLPFYGQQADQVCGVDPSAELLKFASGGLADVADRMAQAVQEAAGGDETIVLGNGYGGFVALQMAIRHPNIAGKLILADCGAAFSEQGRQAFRNMAAASKAKGLSAITDVAMRRLFAPEFQEAHPDLMRDCREAFLRTNREVFQAACTALAELDLRPDLGQVKMPVLVLVGEHDEATPPPMSHELAALLPNARLKTLLGCAHVPQLQSPEVFLDVIGDFLPALRLSDPAASKMGG
jgi:3-oxoadipate enol-lactonase